VVSVRVPQQGLAMLVKQTNYSFELCLGCLQDKGKPCTSLKIAGVSSKNKLKAVAGLKKSLDYGG